MWRFAGPVACLLAGAAHGRQGVTPVQKVVELLTKLRAKVEEQGRDEAASYDKFACFCKEQVDNKGYAISRSDAKISELNATATALEGDIAQLNTDIAGRKGDVQLEQGRSSAALAIRQDAHAVYQGKQGNLTEAIAAITSAVETLRASRDGVNKAFLVSKTQRVIAALPPAVLSMVELGSVGDSRDGFPSSPGSPPVYKYSSGDIIAVLQRLSATFKAKLASVEEEEALARHDFDMLEGARANRVKALQAEIDQKERISAYKSEVKSEKLGLLTDETTARDADQAFLDDLTATCQGKSQTWDQRSRARAAEIAAMTEALGILQGLGDLYGANRRLVGLVST
eukprot:CAMPEP_0168393630 /NCGR_PEP_ID=MMETSP0228-20121227/19117_1 /TAXON_ID=133427 /ORGANISM="Protoceratium reticulatum, Strain CCCM 535 (=CCMP 1889)" /LENGTH=341 /DNA_ID=CAMNT_0008407017 /DNA_START=59 /DNA_END=1080 /DNA_ORIENTATION=-